MRFDLIPTGDWEQLNDQLDQWLSQQRQWAPGYSSYFGLGARLTLFENTLALAHQFSHKRQVSIIKGFSPSLEHLQGYFLKEGFQVQYVAFENLDSFVAGLKKETSFVVWAEDHPVTGERRSWSSDLVKALDTAKVFSVVLSHFQHLEFTREPSSFEIRVGSLSLQHSLVLRGSRAKALPVLFAAQVAWQGVSFQDLMQPVQTFTQDQNLVMNFESKLPSAFVPFFPNEIKNDRSFDRAVIFSSTIHGEFFIRTLAQKLTEKVGTRLLASPGNLTGLETTNLCRWGGITLYRHWWDCEKDLAGVVAIGVEELRLPQFHKAFLLAVEECLSVSV